MALYSRLEEKYGNNNLWQFVKFNIVGYSIQFLQLILANILPLVFDGFRVKLPVFLRVIFNTESLGGLDAKYLVDGVVTWGYVLPFFLSNFLANVYGYFVNMKMTFKGKGTRKGLIVYFVVLIALILFTTWLQGLIAGLLSRSKVAFLSRTIAAWAAGWVQFIVLYPLEKFVLFKEKNNE